MTFLELDGTITIENDDGEYTIQAHNLAPDERQRITSAQAAKLAARYRDVLAALAPRDGIVMHHWHAMRPCERARYVYRKLTFGRRCA